MQFLLLENVHPVATEILSAAGFAVATETAALKEPALCDRVAGVEVLGIRSKTRVTKAVLEAAPSLIAVGAFCIGTNQIDLAQATRRGVPVFNAPFSNTRSVAEMIIAEIVVLARELGDRSREVHEGKWKKTAASSYEIRGKTLGVIGYGHIGRQIGVIAESLGMRVFFYDIAQRLQMGNNHPCSSLDELLGISDFVTLHVPETPLTKHMIAREQLARMKRGAYLLNASRGTVVDVQALADAIRDGHIGGAAIDVYPEEPEGNVESGFVTPLQKLPNVFLTPHVGGSTLEAQQSIGREVSTTLTRFVKTGATTGAVNFPAVELDRAPNTHRVTHVHRNVPGVLRDVNRIVGDLEANIQGQILGTDAEVGYLIMDMEQDVASQVCAALNALPTTIHARRL